MSTDDPKPAVNPAAVDETPVAPAEGANPDPITGEPGAHPVGVGIGALGAGVAGAAVGAFAGPVGVLVGAAIGALAGGLAGKEVAAADDTEPEPPSNLVNRSGDVSEDRETPEALSTVGTAGVLPVASPSMMPEASVAGSMPLGASAVRPETFHDAFTATTLRDTDTENRLAGDDAPDDADDTALDLRGMGSLEENVRVGAYFNYLNRQATGRPGDAMGDWLAAEEDAKEMGS